MEEEMQINCPCCGNLLKADNYSHFCDCGFKMFYRIAGVDVQDQDLPLIFSGQSPLYDFRSREGKPFKAKLKVNLDTKKVEYEFLEELEDTTVDCPICNQKIKNSKFVYKCSCGFQVFKNFHSHNLTEQELKQICNDENPILDLKNKDGVPFKAKVKFNRELKRFDLEYINDCTELNITCPICNQKFKESKFYYQCDCGLKLNKTCCGHQITSDELALILSDQSPIFNFTKKSGEPFQSKLHLDKQRKLFNLGF